MVVLTRLDLDDKVSYACARNNSSETCCHRFCKDNTEHSDPAISPDVRWASLQFLPLAVAGVAEFAAVVLARGWAFRCLEAKYVFWRVFCSSTAT